MKSGNATYTESIINIELTNTEHFNFTQMLQEIRKLNMETSKRKYCFKLQFCVLRFNSLQQKYKYLLDYKIKTNFRFINSIHNGSYAFLLQKLSPLIRYFLFEKYLCRHSSLSFSFIFLFFQLAFQPNIPGNE